MRKTQIHRENKIEIQMYRGDNLIERKTEILRQRDKQKDTEREN
jgi:hypothetical protein